MLYDNGARRSLCRSLAAEIPSLVVFEAVARSEIKASDGALIFMLQDEAKPWVWRFLRWLFA